MSHICNLCVFSFRSRSSGSQAGSTTTDTRSFGCKQLSICGLCPFYFFYIFLAVCPPHLISLLYIAQAVLELAPIHSRGYTTLHTPAYRHVACTCTVCRCLLRIPWLGIFVMSRETLLSVGPYVHIVVLLSQLFSDALKLACLPMQLATASGIWSKPS